MHNTVYVCTVLFAIVKRAALRERRNELPEEHRVAGGGEPRKIGETDTPLPEPKAAAHAINLDGEEASGEHAVEEKGRRQEEGEGCGK